MRVDENIQIDISVLITCYNEQNFIIDTIENVIEALCKANCSYEIIVIDDVSTDNSVNLINEFIQKHPEYPIKLVANKVNRGLANNFVDGAFLSKGRYYRFCCGDNAEPKETLTHLFLHIGIADLVIPYQKQREVVGKSLYRKLLSRFAVILVNAISGFKIKYYNGLPIFLRYHAMRWPPVTYGFGFQMDLITRLLDEGITYVQVRSLNTIDRKDKKSTSLSIRNLLSVAHTLIEIAFRRIRRLLYHKHLPNSIEIKIDE
jgi:glycosyltransferase involved in cell wall biosynthesis